MATAPAPTTASSVERSARTCGSCDNECNSLQSCQAGACVCATGFASCGDACVHLDTDADHCGECGNACAAACSGGECVDDCTDFPDQCGSSCTDTESDSLNCGECGKSCEGDRVCIAGECRKYDLAECDSCPCDCPGGNETCCISEFVGSAVCVDADDCDGGGGG